MTVLLDSARQNIREQNLGDGFPEVPSDLLRGMRTS